jgi:glycosyltransferase involved in cell wall biosynthesis
MREASFAPQLNAAELAARNERMDAAKVVFLVNFLAPNHVAVVEEVARHVDLTVLVSVPVESNRLWEPQQTGIDLRVQRCKTWQRNVRHPSGFTDLNMIHFPLDTARQLKSLNPDVVVSLELGVRSAQASWYSGGHQCGHVVAVYASELSELGRGPLRNALRRWILSRADVVTYNGPSGMRYLQSKGVEDSRLMPWNYAADPTKPYRGSLLKFDDGMERMLTISQMVPRKGLLEAHRALVSWADRSGRHIRWTIAGDGPLRSQLLALPRPDNLELQCVGHVDAAVLRELYRTNEALYFPTLCDEWGLVVDEGLFSGLAVIGSRGSQSVETLVQHRVNGFQFEPLSSDSIVRALTEWAALSPADRMQMRQTARQMVAHRTPEESARQFLAAVAHSHAMRQRSYR